MIPEGPFKFLMFCVYFFLFVGIPATIFAIAMAILWVLEHVRIV